MKTILGLDIGSNSIGWALIEQDFNNKKGKILGMGSRIIPFDSDLIKNFEAGRSASFAAERRKARQMRRLKHRYKLRRERLIKVFKVLGWFPENFPEKFDNLEQFDINKLVPFSSETIEEAKKIFNVENLPIDWTIYYLRDKALKQKITLNELARVIYHFNQRRGFLSSRKEAIDETTTEGNVEASDQNKEIFYEYLKVEEIKDIGEKSGNKKKFQLVGLSSDNVKYEGIITRKELPKDWINQTILFEIKKSILKNGEVKIEFNRILESDWQKQRTALEKEIITSGLHVGQYHFKNLLIDPNYRVKEKVVSRKFYQDELNAIWNKQSEFHPELNDTSKIHLIAQTLYPHNIQKQNELLKSTLLEIIRDDIIYYQRPLKSQKKLISECRFEKKNYIDESGRQHGYKVAPKSSPLFQEFRIWQDIHNLRVYLKEKILDDGKKIFDVDETDYLLDIEGKEKLFELFDTKTNIKIDDILKALSKPDYPVSKTTHRINFPEGKEFKGNETKAKFRSAFKKFNYSDGEKLLENQNKFFELWHIFYSIDDENIISSVLQKRFGFDKDLADYISKLTPFKKEYAAYSSKAIKKLLPLMRCGKYWNENDFNNETFERINKIISGDLISEFPERVREEIIRRNFKSIKDFQGLPVFLATYIVYGIHSERENYEKYDSPDEIKVDKLIPNNSLRNPIVEQIIRETLRVVQDIWKQFRQPDEIHIELARELKNNAETRERITKAIQENERERKRIIEILKHIKNANPNSEKDIEKLRLWEETATPEHKKTMPKISASPTRAEIEKYILWGEQNHISPYTGKAIPLSKLFTQEYEVEHIIPRSRFFDDSFANKTIVEASVNKLKGDLTAYEFINQFGGSTVPGTKLKIFTLDEFKQHILSVFQGRKRGYFLRKEIPKDFINRQIQETRYISRKLGELLYPIAKDDIVFTTGQVTATLKENWGLNRVWREILKPRFERLEKILGEKIISIDKETNDITFNINYDKRIDHRHHALDALVIAATTREHIRYLNSLNAANREDIIKIKYQLVKKGVREFHLPWPTFTKEAKDQLLSIIVSFKKKNRLVQRGYNKYKKWVFENGKWVKKFVPQDRSKLISVRKSLFKEPHGLIHLATYKDVPINKAIEYQFEYLTNFQNHLQTRIADKRLRDKVNKLIKNCSFDLNETIKYLEKHPLKDQDGKQLKKVTILQFKEFSAKRVNIDESFDIGKIEKIPYAHHQKNRIVKILKEHLSEYGNKTSEAFKGEGLGNLYKKFGMVIRKVTTKEKLEKKINLSGKLLEIDKGGNVFFVIYQNLQYPYDRIVTKESTISIFDVVDNYTQGKKITDLGESKPGYKKIILAPNDLVYVPDDGEVIENIDWSNRKLISKKIYKVVSFSKRQIFFVPHFVAKPIVETLELGHDNKSERDWNKNMIRDRLIKLQVDRLGNIYPEL